MAIIFVDSRGRESILSSSNLKRDLSLLKNTRPESSEGLTLSELSGPLGTVFKKLSIEIKKLSSIEVETYFRDNFDVDDLNFIFTLSKTHFLALVYLLYERIISISDITNLIKVDYFTRNEFFLNKLTTIKDEEVDIFSAFKESIKKLEKPTSRIDVEKIYNEVSTLSTLEVAESITPDQFFALKGLFDNSDMLGYDAFKKVKWLEQGGMNIGNSERNGGFYSLEYIVFKFFKDILEAPLLSGQIFSISGLIAVLEYSKYSTYLNYLYQKSKFKDDRRMINTRNFFDIVLNNNFSEHIRRACRDGKFSTISASDMKSMSENAISYVVSDNNKKPIVTNFFDTFRKVMEDESYANQSNIAYNYTGDNNYTGTYDFSFLDHPEKSYGSDFKEILNKIFSGSDRGTADYMGRYFLKKVNQDSVPTSSIVSYSNKAQSIKNSLDILFKNSFSINNDGKVVSIGNYGKTEYVKIALTSALTAIKNQYPPLTIEKIETFDIAKSYFGRIAAELKEEIIGQTSIDNLEISRKPENNIFKHFFADILVSYLLYIVNGNDDEFIPSVSEEIMELYRGLNFIKHTFINIKRFLKSVRIGGFYTELSLMLLAIREDMTLDEIKKIFKNGVNTDELVNLLDIKI